MESLRQKKELEAWKKEERLRREKDVETASPTEKKGRVLFVPRLEFRHIKNASLRP